MTGNVRWIFSCPVFFQSLAVSSSRRASCNVDLLGNGGKEDPSLDAYGNLAVSRRGRTSRKRIPNPELRAEGRNARSKKAGK